MAKCYVVLMHQPNIECPEHEVTTLLTVTSTLLLAEKAIAKYCSDEFGKDGEVLVCQIMPMYIGARAYSVAEHFGSKNATTFTVTEEAIID